jgi:hypothetical protein
VIRAKAFTTLTQGETGLLHPIFAVDHALDSVAQLKHVEVDEKPYTYSA